MHKIYALSRISLAIIFFYHGLIPKLLFQSREEVLMNETFMPWMEESFALISSGVAEIVFAVLLLVFYRIRSFNYLIMGFGLVATIAIAAQLPTLLTEAFNPFSTNLAIVMFSWTNLLAWTPKEGEEPS